MAVKFAKYKKNIVSVSDLECYSFEVIQMDVRYFYPYVKKLNLNIFVVVTWLPQDVSGVPIPLPG